MRFIWKVTKGLTYYITALVFALLFALGIFGAIGYHYYEGYYAEYLEVQKSWTQVDQKYTSLTNTLEEGLPVVIRNSKTDKETKNMLNIAKKTVSDAAHAMSYAEKHSIYPSLYGVSKDLQVLTRGTKNKDIRAWLSEVSTIQSEITSSEQEYNARAKRFNEMNERFPEKYISELGSFHPWNEIQR